MPVPGPHFRRQARQTKPARGPVRVAPEIQRSAPPARRPVLGPPAPKPKPVGVFAPFKPQQQAAKIQQKPARVHLQRQVQRAGNKLPPVNLPQFPDIKMTPKQRKVVIERTTKAVRNLAAQRGEHAGVTAQKLYNEGGEQVRKTLHLYSRAVHEQRTLTDAHALHGLLTAAPNPNLNKLTAGERRQWRETGTIAAPQTAEGRNIVAHQRQQASLRQEVAKLAPTAKARAEIYRFLTDPQRSQARPGPARPGGIGGVVPLAAIQGYALSPEHNLIAAGMPGFKALGGGFVKDAISLPRDVVTSTYFTGAALFEAVKGDPSRLKELGVALKDHDPFILAAQGRWDEAAKALNEHPLDTLLELGGARGITRAGGRLAGGRAATLRESAVVPGTALEQARSFSTSPIARAVQKRMERHHVSKAQSLYEQAAKAEREGSLPPEEIDRLYAEATQRDPRIMSTGDVQHRADIHEALGQPERRRGGAELHEAMKPLTVSPRQGGHLQRPIAEGTAPIRRLEDGSIDVAAIRHDFAAKAQKLKVAEAKLRESKDHARGRKLSQNLAYQRRIGEMSKLSDEHLREIAERSGTIARLTNKQEARNIAANQLDPQEALRARIQTYAQEHMDARKAVPTALQRDWEMEAANARLLNQRVPPRPKPRLVAPDEHGALVALEPKAILEHMRAGGVDPNEIAFVTQRPGELGARAYNVRSLAANLTRKGFPTRTRTGRALEQGLIDTHPSRLTANVIRMQQLEAADRNYVKSLNDVMARRPDGNLRLFDSKGEGEQWAQSAHFDEHGNRIHGAPTWRIVRVNPWGGREAQLQHLIRHGDEEGFVKTAQGVDHPIARAIEAAVSPDAPEGAGPWAAVPAEWANRIRDHSEVYRSSSPTMRAITSMFRNTVLPTSLPWLTGNTVEATARALIQSPRLAHNYMTYRRVIKAIERVDPEEAARIRDSLGTGHYGMSEVSDTYRSLAQFSDSKMKVIAEPLIKLRHAPGTRWLPDLYHRYTQFVFHEINQRIETPFREAMAGYHIRQKFGSDKLAQMSAKAVEDAANGLRNTNAQVEMADAVRRAYGQYEAFSPRQRKFIVLYSPFMAWALNAGRFLVDVLPRDHPVLTAMLAAQNRATQDWRQQHGLDEYGPSPVPPFLFGSIPVAGGGHIRASRYTPFGAFTDPTGTLADLVLPQFSGAIMAARGLSWTGEPLKKHEQAKTDEKIKAMIVQGGESVVPLIGRIQQALGYEGSVGSKFLQSENPFRVVRKKGSTASQVTLPKQADAQTDWSGAARSSSTVQSDGIDWSAAARNGR